MDDMVGLEEVFNRALGLCLLYQFERVQFARQLASASSSTMLSHVYGFEHLLRLVAKMPELMTAGGAPPEVVAQQLRCVAAIIAYLETKISDLVVDYVSADPAYCSQAVA